MNLNERIQTKCPSCGGQSLFVGSGGHLTCSYVDCPEPVMETAIAALEAELEACQRENEKLLWLAYGKPDENHKDGNHDLIVTYIRAQGASVQDFSGLGYGWPDLHVGYEDGSALVEIKNPEADGKMSRSQYVRAYLWQGHTAVVKTTDDCDHLLGLLEKAGEAFRDEPKPRDYFEAALESEGGEG